MKKIFTKPDIEIIKFDEKADVICTSGEGNPIADALFGGDNSGANAGIIDFKDLYDGSNNN